MIDKRLFRILFLAVIAFAVVIISAQCRSKDTDQKEEKPAISAQKEPEQRQQPSVPPPQPQQPAPAAPEPGAPSPQPEEQSQPPVKQEPPKEEPASPKPGAQQPPVSQPEIKPAPPETPPETPPATQPPPEEPKPAPTTGDEKAPAELIFKAKNGDVVFNHAKHGEREGKCEACHDSIFPKDSKQPLNFKEKMHQPATQAKTSCAACHVAEGKAFPVNNNCAKCHKKKA